MKKIIITILIFIITINMDGCIKKDSESKELNILTFEKKENIEFIIQKFTKTYQSLNYTINIDYIDDYTELDKDLNILKNYDIFSYHYKQIEALVENNLVYENSVHNLKPKIYDAGGPSRATEYKGRLFGFSYTATTYLLYYDNSIFTLEDVSDIEKLLDKNTLDTQSNLGINLDDPLGILSYYLGAEVKIFPDWNIFDLSFDNHQSVEISKAITKFKQKKVIDISYEEAENLFENKKLGAIIAPLNKSLQYQEALKERFAVSILPTFTLECNNTKHYMTPPVEVFLYAINKETKHIKIASDLIYFITNEESQHYRYLQDKTPPTIKSISQKKDIYENDVMSKHLMQMQYSIPLSNTSKTDMFLDSFGVFIKELYNDKVFNVEERITSITKEIKLK